MPRIIPMIIAIMLLTMTSDLIAHGTNFIVIDRLHPRFTVKEGKLALACVRLIGLQSVEAFPKEHSLVTDGVVGPKTWDKLSAALLKRGIEIKRTNLPITLSISAAENEQVCFEIHNGTTNDIVIQAGQRLNQSEAGKRLLIPVSVKFSRQKGDRWSNGSDTTTLSLDLPTHIQPQSSVKWVKSYRRTGNGATELRMSIVATENEKHIFLLEANPLLLKEDVRFPDK